MNKKKLGTGLVALALVGVVGIGGSLAWFTDTESKTNTFSTGKIDITLKEYYGNGQEAPDGMVYKDVMPGDDLVKCVIVENNEQDAWLRLKVSIPTSELMTLERVKGIEFIKNDEVIEFDGEWKVEDGACVNYITCPRIVGTNDAYTFFDRVKIPGSWSNEMASQTFTIDVTAQAVQSQNNDDGFNATDLTEEDIIVAE